MWYKFRKNISSPSHCSFPGPKLFQHSLENLWTYPLIGLLPEDKPAGFSLPMNQPVSVWCYEWKAEVSVVSAAGEVTSSAVTTQCRHAVWARGPPAGGEGGRWSYITPTLCDSVSCGGNLTVSGVLSLFGLWTHHRNITGLLYFPQTARISLRPVA